MLLQGLLLGEIVDVVGAEGGVSDLVSVEVLSQDVQLIISVLEAEFELSNLSTEVKVASRLELVFLAELE